MSNNDSAPNVVIAGGAPAYRQAIEESLLAAGFSAIQVENEPEALAACVAPDMPRAVGLVSLVPFYGMFPEQNAEGKYGNLERARVKDQLRWMGVWQQGFVIAVPNGFGLGSSQLRHGEATMLCFNASQVQDLGNMILETMQRASESRSSVPSGR